MGYFIWDEHELGWRILVWEAHTLLNILGLVELDDFNLGKVDGTSLLMSGRKEPMPNLKGK